MSLSYPEVSAILGVVGITAGTVVKIFYKPDAQLKSRVEKLETKLLDTEKDIENIHTQVEKFTKMIDEQRIRDNENRERVIEKIENKIEKLSDMIMKFILKEKN